MEASNVNIRKISVFVFGIGMSAAAFATNGYFSSSFGVKAEGMGGVGIALPQDALAAATNPAGIAFVEDRVDLGVDLFVPTRSAEITGNGAARNGTYDGNGAKSFLIPQFGYNKNLSPVTTVGVAVYGNGGINTKYQRSPFGGNWGGQNPAGVNLGQLFFAPTVAYKISPKQSIGISVLYVYQYFSAYGLQGFSGFSSSPNNLTNQGLDTSTGWGSRLGWTGEVSDTVTLGLTYSGRISTSSFSKYRGLFAGSGNFDIPENYGAGVAVRVAPQLTLGFDVQQINFGKIKSVGNPLSNLTVLGNPIGSNNGPGFGWRNVTAYKLGASYEYSKQLMLRAGFSTTHQSIPAGQTLFNILAPGVVENHLTLGTTWTFENKGELSFGYIHVFSNTVKGVGSIPAFLGSGEVNLKMYEDTLGICYGWKL